ncbi:hypothetical protein [Streptomyces sp. NPDC086782]|uniref:hypothetical protein n=1 Tax=Streptomyces sp. NPDC086782 TaxID=3365757 RepID=UPI0037F8E71D
MITRQFARNDLLRLGLPPDSPEEIKYRDDVHADEHVRQLKYTQLRRVVFDAPDGGTYVVEYEAPMNTGDYEVGGGSVENHGWGRTVTAIQVEERPVAVMRWMPVPDGEDAREEHKPVLEHLAETYVETGCRDADSRGYAAQTLAEHTRELADLLREAHPDAARALDGHARDLDEQAQ